MILKKLVVPGTNEFGQLFMVNYLMELHFDKHCAHICINRLRALLLDVSQFTFMELYCFFCLLVENIEHIHKPKPWKHSEPITRTQLMKMRDEFWDTAPHYGGRKGILF